MSLLTSQAQVVLFPFSTKVLVCRFRCVRRLSSGRYQRHQQPTGSGWSSRRFSQSLIRRKYCRWYNQGLENRSELIRKGHQQLKNSAGKTARMTLKLYQEVAQNHQ